MRCLIAGAFALSLIAAGSSASAAVYVVTRGDAGQGLSIQGNTVLGAWNINGGSQTVQGVAFVPTTDSSTYSPVALNVDGSNDFSAGFSFAGTETSSNDTALKTVIDGGKWFYSTGYQPSKLTISGLTAGRTYQIDLLSSGGGRTMHVGYNMEAGFTAANGVDQQALANGVAYNFSNLVTALPSGRIYVNFINSSGFVNPVVSGVSVTQVVPEPTSLAAIGLAGVLGLRRRCRTR